MLVSDEIIVCNRRLRSAKQIHGLDSATPIKTESLNSGTSVRKTSFVRSNAPSTAVLAVNITHINLHMNLLSSLEGLEACVNLRSLDASSNALKRMDSTLLCFPKLSELNLNGNHISVIENLSRCRELTSLSLAFNRLTTLKGLLQLPNPPPLLLPSKNTKRPTVTNPKEDTNSSRGPSPISRSTTPQRLGEIVLRSSAGVISAPLLEFLDLRCNLIGANEFKKGKRLGQGARKQVDTSRLDSDDDGNSRRGSVNGKTQQQWICIEGRGLLDPFTAENSRLLEDDDRDGFSADELETAQSPARTFGNQVTSQRKLLAAHRILEPLKTLKNLRELRLQHKSYHLKGNQTPRPQEEEFEMHLKKQLSEEHVRKAIHPGSDLRSGILNKHAVEAEVKTSFSPALYLRENPIVEVLGSASLTEILSKVAPQLSFVDGEEVGIDLTSEHQSNGGTQSSQTLATRQMLVNGTNKDNSPAVVEVRKQIRSMKDSAPSPFLHEGRYIATDVETSMSLPLLVTGDGSKFLPTDELQRRIEGRLRALENEYDAFILKEKLAAELESAENAASKTSKAHPPPLPIERENKRDVAAQIHVDGDSTNESQQQTPANISNNNVSVSSTSISNTNTTNTTAPTTPSRHTQTAARHGESSPSVLPHVTEHRRSRTAQIIATPKRKLNLSSKRTKGKADEDENPTNQPEKDDDDEGAHHVEGRILVSKSPRRVADRSRSSEPSRTAGAGVKVPPRYVDDALVGSSSSSNSCSPPPVDPFHMGRGRKGNDGQTSLPPSLPIAKGLDGGEQAGSSATGSPRGAGAHRASSSAQTQPHRVLRNDTSGDENTSPPRPSGITANESALSSDSDENTCTSSDDGSNATYEPTEREDHEEKESPAATKNEKTKRRSEMKKAQTVAVAEKQAARPLFFLKSPDAILADLVGKEASALRNELTLRDQANRIEAMRAAEVEQREALVTVAMNRWNAEKETAVAAARKETEQRLSVFYEKEMSRSVDEAVERERQRHKRQMGEYKTKKDSQFRSLRDEVMRLLGECSRMNSELSRVAHAHAEDLRRAADESSRKIESDWKTRTESLLSQQEASLRADFQQQMSKHIESERLKLTETHARELETQRRFLEESALREVIEEREAAFREMDLTRDQDRRDAETKFKQRLTLVELCYFEKLQIVSDAFASGAGQRDLSATITAQKEDEWKKKTQARVFIEAGAQTKVCLAALASHEEAFEHVQAKHLQGLLARNEDLERKLSAKDEELAEMRKLSQLRNTNDENENESVSNHRSLPKPIAITAFATNSNPNHAADTILLEQIIEQHARTIANLKSSLEARDAQITEIEDEARAKIDEKRDRIRSLEDLLALNREKCEILEDKLHLLEDQQRDSEGKKNQIKKEIISEVENRLREEFSAEYRTQLSTAISEMDASVRAHYEAQMAESLQKERANLQDELDTFKQAFSEDFSQKLHNEFEREKSRLLSLIAALREQLTTVHEESQRKSKDLSLMKTTIIPEMKAHMTVLQREIDKRQAAEGAEKERRLRQEKALIGALQELSA